MRRDLYADVSARIVAELERGAAPWVKPWSVTPGQNVPQNAISNRPYSGCNVILLWLTRDRGWITPRFLTFNQAIDAGGHVRKGEHGTKVYFVKQLQIKDDRGPDAEAWPASPTCRPNGRGNTRCWACLQHRPVEPSLCRLRSPFPGNGNLGTRDRTREMAHPTETRRIRDRARAHNPAKSASFT